MRRREVIVLLGGTAATLTLASPARAQQQLKKQPRLAILLYSTIKSDPNLASFLNILREFGYVEGQNIAIEYRSAEDRPERLPGLATELAHLKPDLVFCLGGDVILPAARVIQTIPLVFVSSADPVRLGVVASLARPGGNATGVTLILDDLASKRLELLKEVAPRVSRVAFVWNPDHPDNELHEAERAADKLGVKLRPITVRGPDDVEAALHALGEAHPDALYVASSRHTVRNLPRFVGFATANRIPLIGGWGAWAKAGGLLSYGPNFNEMLGNAANYVVKILNGAKPAELPVQQPTRFELVINLRTAKALGLMVADSLLARADEVIE
jgi:putative ABC transport system substrate-binding protein